MNAAELVQHYRDVHKRLWGTPPAAPARPQEAALVRLVPPPPPERAEDELRIRAALRAIAMLSTPTMTDVQMAVAEAYGVPFEMMSQRRGLLNYSVARHVGMTICRLLLGKSSHEISGQFGLSDHVCVLYASKKYGDAVSDAMDDVDLPAWTPPPPAPKKLKLTPWTPESVAILREMWPGNVHCAAIAEVLGVSKYAVQKKARRIGLRRSTRAKCSADAWYRRQLEQQEAENGTHQGCP